MAFPNPNCQAGLEIIMERGKAKDKAKQHQYASIDDALRAAHWLPTVPPDNSDVERMTVEKSVAGPFSVSVRRMSVGYYQVLDANINVLCLCWYREHAELIANALNSVSRNGRTHQAESPLTTEEIMNDWKKLQTKITKAYTNSGGTQVSAIPWDILLGFLRDMLDQCGAKDIKELASNYPIIVERKIKNRLIYNGESRAEAGRIAAATIVGINATSAPSLQAVVV